MAVDLSGNHHEIFERWMKLTLNNMEYCRINDDYEGYIYWMGQKIEVEQHRKKYLEQSEQLGGQMLQLFFLEEEKQRLLMEIKKREEERDKLKSDEEKED